MPQTPDVPPDPRAVYAPLSVRARALALDGILLVLCFVALDVGLALPVLDALRPWPFVAIICARLRAVDLDGRRLDC